MVLLVSFFLFSFDVLYLLVTQGARIFCLGADVLKNQLATKIEVLFSDVVFENCINEIKQLFLLSLGHSLHLLFAVKDT